MREAHDVLAEFRIVDDLDDGCGKEERRKTREKGFYENFNLSCDLKSGPSARVAKKFEPEAVSIKHPPPQQTSVHM